MGMEEDRKRRTCNITVDYVCVWWWMSDGEAWREWCCSAIDGAEELRRSGVDSGRSEAAREVKQKRRATTTLLVTTALSATPTASLKELPPSKHVSPPPRYVPTSNPSPRAVLTSNPSTPAASPSPLAAAPRPWRWCGVRAQSGRIPVSNPPSSAAPVVVRLVSSCCKHHRRTYSAPARTLVSHFSHSTGLRDR